MNRILIIGCSGSGKSTLAKRLGDRLQLPVVHLDQHYFSPNWVETPTELWREKIQALVAEHQWVMDGNYGGTFDLRFPRADQIIYLNFSTRKCLFRVLRRW